LGGALAALVARLLPRLGPAHDPSVPSHFLSTAVAADLLASAHVTATRVPIESGGQQVEATVLLAPAAAAAEEAAAAAGGKKEKKVKKEKEKKKPLVLMLHGFPDDAATYFAQLAPLTAAGYDVVVPVLPGYEPSTAGLPAAAYSLPSIARALGQVAAWALREQGREKVDVAKEGID